MGETKIPNVYEYGIPVVVAATNNLAIEFELGE